MTAKNYARLAAVIFAIVAVLQLGRALSGLPVTVGATSIPLWASWIAASLPLGLPGSGLVHREAEAACVRHTTYLAAIFWLVFFASASANWFNKSEQYLAACQDETVRRYHRNISSEDGRRTSLLMHDRTRLRI